MSGKKKYSKETSKRQKMISSQVFEILSLSIVSSLSDPRVKNISITQVDVSGDLSVAKIYIATSIEGGNLDSAIEGLNSARGFLKRELAKRLGTKKIPDLKFFIDNTLYAAWKIEEVIADINEDDNCDE
jgi:ribosome-binding factor A